MLGFSIVDKMIAVSVSVNGEPACVAGATDMGVIYAIIGASGKLGPQSVGTERFPGTVDVDLRLSGLTRPRDSKAAANLSWLKRKLHVGDQVVIRIVEATDADAPATSAPADLVSEEDERSKFEEIRDIYLELRKKYEAGEP